MEKTTFVLFREPVRKVTEENGGLTRNIKQDIVRTTSNEGVDPLTYIIFSKKVTITSEVQKGVSGNI